MASRHGGLVGKRDFEVRWIVGSEGVNVPDALGSLDRPKATALYRTVPESFLCAGCEWVCSVTFDALTFPPILGSLSV